MKLNYLLYISDFTGCRTDHISGSFTVLELIRELCKRYGHVFADNVLISTMTDISGEVTVLVDGINIEFLKGPDTMVEDKDTVTFLPNLMGG